MKHRLFALIGMSIAVAVIAGPGLADRFRCDFSNALGRSPIADSMVIDVQGGLYATVLDDNIKAAHGKPVEAEIDFATRKAYHLKWVVRNHPIPPPFRAGLGSSSIIRYKAQFQRQTGRIKVNAVTNYDIFYAQGTCKPISP
ncbi:hypothetical protein RXV86_05735 [Alisedimentitalea sp. MJ-SS2]|uniref:hypothetical protein n=1 Tax=Aliisedimentitalea sp. MJ-SS2 TaxID=3049795 RepID=UPI00290C9F9F|nr:hypothetical protein [Alisedimentitalea sp. MJ-SS2]MDU8926877.1 hypothetical protein [Alisedimentitalea sp. MJ-SS2]